MKTADAVIIGAGINGASTAYNLVRRGLKHVVLLERQLIASAGTGRSAAIVRQHYSNDELVQMVKRSVEIFHQFDELVGGDPGFVNTGWAFLLPRHASDGLTRNLERGRRLGVDVRELTKEELSEIEPRMELEDVDRVAYEPSSGYADPRAATYAYVKRFMELGGHLRPLSPARGLIVNDGSIVAVRTDAGDIHTPLVVNAAGPWADRVARWAGLELPMRVTREQEIVFETTDVGGPPRLCYSDMAQAIYYRPEGQTRMLVGRGFPKEYEYVDPDGYDEQVDKEFIEDAMTRLHRRWPQFERAVPINAYSGLYDVTPDWHPVLGRVDGLDGFCMCAGFSGHGFKIGPSVGELMAEEILDGRARSIDISRYNLSRFARGDLIGTEYGGNRA